jgi:hypothetical protein
LVAGGTVGVLVAVGGIGVFVRVGVLVAVGGIGVFVRVGVSVGVFDLVGDGVVGVAVGVRDEVGEGVVGVGVYVFVGVGGIAVLVLVRVTVGVSVLVGVFDAVGEGVVGVGVGVFDAVGVSVAVQVGASRGASVTEQPLSKVIVMPKLLAVSPSAVMAAQALSVFVNRASRVAGPVNTAADGERVDQLVELLARLVYVPPLRALRLYRNPLLITASDGLST